MHSSISTSFILLSTELYKMLQQQISIFFYLNDKMLQLLGVSHHAPRCHDLIDVPNCGDRLMPMFKTKTKMLNFHFHFHCSTKLKHVKSQFSFLT